MKFCLVIIFSGMALLLPKAGVSEEMRPIIKVSRLNTELLEPDMSYLQWVALGGLQVFQNFISPVDGDRCRMSPTCSGYSKQAYRKYGLIIGSILTADRLQHEGNEYLVSPIADDDGVQRVFDPLDNNVFWWNKKGEL